MKLFFSKLLFDMRNADAKANECWTKQIDSVKVQRNPNGFYSIYCISKTYRNKLHVNECWCRKGYKRTHALEKYNRKHGKRSV